MEFELQVKDESAEAATHQRLEENMQVVYLTPATSDYLIDLIRADWNKPRNPLQKGELVTILDHIKALGFFELHEEYMADFISQFLTDNE